MADKKKTEKVELDAAKENPKFLYHLTQKYMKDYVQKKGTVEDQIWYYKLVLASKKQVTRGDATFDVLDLTKVRKEFVSRFFPGLGERKANKPSYFDEIEKLLKELEK